MPARTADARLSTASGHTSASSRCRRRPRPTTIATGRYPPNNPKASDTLTVRETTSTATNTTVAVAAHTAHRPVTDVPVRPARSNASRVRPKRACRLTGRGDTNESQINTSPTPTPRPTTAPTSPTAVQQGADVDADPLVALGVRRHALRPHQMVPLAQEQWLGLDHVVLHTPGNPDNLLDASNPVVADAEMHHEIHRRGNRRYHEAGGDVLAGKERQGTHLHQCLPRRVRVQGSHPGQAGVQGQQQVKTLLGTNLADDHPRGPHPQALLHQVAELDLPRALKSALPGLHRHPVRVREAQLEHPLDRDDTLAPGNAGRQAVEHRSLHHITDKTP